MQNILLNGQKAKPMGGNQMQGEDVARKKRRWKEGR